MSAVGSRRVVMTQGWRDLLFAHWAWDPDALRSHLPPGLRLDTFQGRAYVGIVPFGMHRIRLLGWVPLARGRLCELNLRTYVRDAHDRPGVWFFTLEAGRRTAVWAARRFYHLPYRHAAMAFAQDPDGTRRFRCHRSEMSPSTLAYAYRPEAKAPAAPAEPGSLSHFLVERYRLFSHDAGRDALCTAEIAHEAYPLRPVELGACDPGLFAWCGLPVPERPPDHAVYAEGVDVRVFPLARVSGPTG